MIVTKKFGVSGIVLATLAASGWVSAAQAGHPPTFVARSTSSTVAIVDASGDTWEPLAGYRGPYRTTTLPAGRVVAGTAEPALYQVNAYDVSGYRTAVPRQGRYSVRLLLNEHYWTKPGQRVFDVTSEGRPALTGVDIVGEAGAMTAHERTFEVDVEDGWLDVDFRATKDRAMVVGIEVRLTQPRQTPMSFDRRLTASPETITDAEGNTWEPWASGNGPAKRSALLVGRDIGGTQDDALYAVGGYGAATIRVPVPAVGRYRVRVLTAEGYWSKPGQRTFSLVAEGETAAADVDIVAAVGPAHAHDITFDTLVDDGVLDLDLVKGIDHPMITGVEIVFVPAPSPTPSDSTNSTAPESPAPTDPNPPFIRREVAADGDVVDSQGRSWSRMGPSFGTSLRSGSLRDKEIAGTDDDELYRFGAYGQKGYLLTVPAPGTYRVRLLLAEGYWTAPRQRVFDVIAEGRLVAPQVDIVAAVGRAHAYDVEFPVEVTDGQLTMQFRAIADKPMISAIEVIGDRPAPIGSDAARPNVTFSADSFYTAPLSDAPLADNSAAVVANLARDVAERSSGIAAVNAYQYNASFYRVPADQPGIRVGFVDCQSKGYVPSGFYDGPRYFEDVPVPDDAVPATGTDGEMSIYDPAGDRLWEFWQMRRARDGGWEACWGGRLDDVSSAQGVFPAPFGASASGLVMAGGMIGIDEAVRGRIDHAMYLGVVQARALVASWPANRTDGGSDDPDVVMEGQRLRLDPSVDVESLDLTPFGRMVARAAQRYGFIVSDRSGTVGVVTESGVPMKAATGIDPWDVLVGESTHVALRGFPWERLQAIAPDYGRPAEPLPEESADPEPTPTSTSTHSGGAEPTSTTAPSDPPTDDPADPTPTATSTPTDTLHARPAD